MRLSRSIWFVLFTLLLFVEVQDVHAQWKNIAPNIVTPPYILFGAISYHNGLIIAAISGTAICVSSDDGKNWQTITAPYGVGDQPHDVDIFDSKNAIIATYKSGLYITHDGGLTWTATNLTTSLNAAKFIGTSNDIIAAAPFGHQLISHDAGITWSQILSSGSTGQNDVQVQRSDLSIHALETGGNSGGGKFGDINSTTDGGATWNQSTGRFYSDSYSLTLDPCNDSLMYVINEGNFNPGPDGLGHIFYSHNRGKTFAEVNAMDMKYYCGSIVCAPGGTLYLQTQTSDGIIRSTDRGLNWKSIGGPVGFSDSRLVCCKDDNTIFAVDAGGSIWETTNSGGDSITTIPNNGSLSATPRIVFINDTVYCTDSITRRITYNISGCPSPTISGWLLSGGDAVNYKTSKNPDGSLNITFIPKRLGAHQSKLILNLSNGKQDTVMLRGFHDSKPFQYSISPRSLFVNDTVHCTDSLSQTLIYKTTGCFPPAISGWLFSGLDSLSYNANKAASDSLKVSFTPKKLGSHNAILIISLANGDRDTITLKGYNDSKPFLYSLTPTPLFSGDTVALCDSQIRKASLKMSGCLPKIKSQGIVGNSGNDYQILKSIGDPLISGDSVSIEFKPTAGGMRNAAYELTLSDGTKISLPLEGVGNNIPFSFSSDPSSLFSTDSLYLCSSDSEHKVIISVSGCNIPKIISQTISGTASTDYTIIGSINSTINHSDSLLIDFKPSATGLRAAQLVLTFADGTLKSIPLQGFGIAPHQLNLITTDQTTNTIGGTVDVPITISGLDHPEDVELVLHYNTELNYRGSYSPMNLQLDQTGSQSRGRSKLHIAQAIPNAIIGYAKFDVFNDSLTKSEVTFDSVAILSTVLKCQYILPESVTSIITSPSGCGIDIISRFMHRGILPQLSIIPNPSSGEISIVSTHDLGEVNISVYDMLGVRQSTSSAILHKNNPAKIILAAANGVYNVKVQSAERTYDLRVVVNK